MTETITMPDRFGFQDLTGKCYGRLCVTGYAGKTCGGCTSWACDCDCGTQVVVRAASLKKGTTQSCGCYARDRRIAAKYQHGFSGTSEYNTWVQMRLRCSNSRHKSYQHYGGRGISVCPRCRDSFQAFVEDMGQRPSPKHELERLNNNGNYAPENCCWATAGEQHRNTRRNHYITFNGETKVLSDWADVLGISRTTLSSRIQRGWTIGRAFSSTIQQRRTTALKAD